MIFHEDATTVVTCLPPLFPLNTYTGIGTNVSPMARCMLRGSSGGLRAQISHSTPFGENFPTQHCRPATGGYKCYIMCARVNNNLVGRLRRQAASRCFREVLASSGPLSHGWSSLGTVGEGSRWQSQGQAVKRSEHVQPWNNCALLSTQVA